MGKKFIKLIIKFITEILKNLITFNKIKKLSINEIKIFKSEQKKYLKSNLNRRLNCINLFGFN